MLKVFISQPMNGKSQNQIESDRMIATSDAIMQVSNDFGVEVGKIKIINSVLKDYAPKSSPLLYLGESIKMMADADVVYFFNGWENAHGCLIEHECAKKYGKRVIYF